MAKSGKAQNKILKLHQEGAQKQDMVNLLVLEAPRSSGAEIKRILEQSGYRVKDGDQDRFDSTEADGSKLVFLEPCPGGPKQNELSLLLRASEDRFRTLADNISQFAWMADEQGWIFWYNKRWFDYTGTTLPEMEGWGWKKVHHPEHVERVVHKFQQAVSNGQPWEDTFPLRAKDGTYRWFLSRALPIDDGNGKVVRWFGTNTDITELKEAEAVLQRQAALIDLTPTAMLVRTLEGTISLWNRAAESLYGWTRAEAIGRDTHELLKTEFPQPADEILNVLQRTGRWSGDLRHYTRDGRVVVVQSSWLAERRPDGEILDILESNVDMTERKRFQEELELLVHERTRRLQESVSDLEHFSYTITHDMRAPLRAMQTFGQILQSEYGEHLDDSGRDFLERIIRSSHRMDALITDALSYAKVVRQEMELEPVDLAGLLKGMIESYPEFQTPRAEIQIESGLPWVLGNKAGLTQCFSNLLGNAVKFVPAGTFPKVRIWAEPGAENVRVWVEDNGIGISSEGQKKIFTMFQRLSKEHEGTGIGLALVRKVVERMRGKVGVLSQPGCGSRFWVELQLADPPQT